MADMKPVVKLTPHKGGEDNCTSVLLHKDAHMLCLYSQVTATSE